MQQTVRTDHRILMDQSENADDIRVYIRSHLTDLVNDELLAVKDVSFLEDGLLRGANGMFLWAALLMRHLQCPILTPEERLRMINDVISPEGLDQMYDRIISVIEQSREMDKVAAKKVFCWPSYSRWPVSLRMLYDDICEGDELE